MSRHSKPEDGKIVRIEWAQPESYRGPWRRKQSAGYAVPLLFLAIAVGVVVGYTQSQAPQEQADPSAIEWNKVQALPTRAWSADEIAWARRGQEAALAEVESAGESGAAPATAAVRASGLLLFRRRHELRGGR